MHYLIKNADNTLTATNFDEANAAGEYITRHDFNSLEEAQEAAARITNGNFIGIDSGRHVSPRFDVARMPQVGDDVSYGFNGDAYPCGQVKSISKSLKVITTTTGDKFYRRKLTGTWKKNGTWSLIKGHVDKRNPSF